MHLESFVRSSRLSETGTHTTLVSTAAQPHFGCFSGGNDILYAVWRLSGFHGDLHSNVTRHPAVITESTECEGNSSTAIRGAWPVRERRNTEIDFIAPGTHAGVGDPVLVNGMTSGS